MSDRFRFFTEDELVCRCGKCGLGQENMDVEFMNKLIELRQMSQIIMPVTSAVRCPWWNNKQSSTGSDGPHTPDENGCGHAVDIHVWGENAYHLIRLAIKHQWFTGIGIKQTGPYKSRFIHLDDLTVDSGKPRPWIWTY